VLPLGILLNMKLHFDIIKVSFDVAAIIPVHFINQKQPFNTIQPAAAAAIDRL